MTPATDLQKLLAGERQTLMYPERLQEIKRRTGSAAYESYQLADEALTLLSERDTLAARVLELEAENKRLREGLFWIADIGFVQEKHAKQHADDCCKLARETLGYQEQAALKGGEI